MGNWFTVPPGTILQPGDRAWVEADLLSGSGPIVGSKYLGVNASVGGMVINKTDATVLAYDPVGDSFIQPVSNGPLRQQRRRLSGQPMRVGTCEDFEEPHMATWFSASMEWQQLHDGTGRDAWHAIRALLPGHADRCAVGSEPFSGSETG